MFSAIDFKVNSISFKIIPNFQEAKYKNAPKQPVAKCEQRDDNIYSKFVHKISLNVRPFKLVRASPSVNNFSSFPSIH
jgi:hypothetical protein